MKKKELKRRIKELEEQMQYLESRVSGLENTQYPQPYIFSPFGTNEWTLPEVKITCSMVAPCM